MNILLVEDEELIRNSIKEILEYYFKEVFVASDGYQALKLYEKNRIDTILTDYEMPNMNGYDFIKEVQSRSDKIPITIVSNHDDKDILLSCITLNLAGYLLKPFKFETVKQYLVNLAKYLNDNNLLWYNFSNNHKLDLINNILVEDENKNYNLTALESDFLRYLVHLDGSIATYELIFEELYQYDLTLKSLKDLVYRIKTKYNFNYIRNIKEIGYILIK